MEDDLDRIAAGREEWQPYIKEFYHGQGGAGFHAAVVEAMAAKGYPTLELGLDPSTNKALTVKSGKYGTYLQRGGAGAADKTALPDTLPPAELTLEKAATLLLIQNAEPRTLGVDTATGKQITLRTGRYGPYLQLGEDEGKDKAKKMSLTYGPKQIPISQTINQDTISLPQALQIISLPRVLGEEGGEKISASVGRFGPYVKKGDEFRSVPKNMDVLTITLEEARVLLAQEKTGNRRKKTTVIKELGSEPASGKPVQVLDGRYGPYIANGTRVFVSVPKETEPETVTLAQALEWIEAKKKKKKAK